MPIDTSGPAIRPPSALEFLEEDRRNRLNPDLDMRDPGSDTGEDWGGGEIVPDAPPTAVSTPAYRPDAAGRAMGEQLVPDLVGFSRDVLQNPSRWDMGMVQDATRLIDDEILEGRQAGRRFQDEYFSQRGLVGSNVEADAVTQLIDEGEDSRLERLHSLNRDLAETLSADRATAFGVGSGTADLMRALGLDREDSNRFGAEFGRQTGRDAEDDTRYRSNFAEDQRRFGIDTGLRDRGLDLQELGLTGNQRLAELDILLRALASNAIELDDPRIDWESIFGGGGAGVNNGTDNDPPPDEDGQGGPPPGDEVESDVGLPDFTTIGSTIPSQNRVTQVPAVRRSRGETTEDAVDFVGGFEPPAPQPSAGGTGAPPNQSPMDALYDHLATLSQEELDALTRGDGPEARLISEAIRTNPRRAVQNIRSTHVPGASHDDGSVTENQYLEERDTFRLPDNLTPEQMQAVHNRWMQDYEVWVQGGRVGPEPMPPGSTREVGGPVASMSIEEILAQLLAMREEEAEQG